MGVFGRIWWSAVFLVTIPFYHIHQVALFRLSLGSKKKFTEDEFKEFFRLYARLLEGAFEVEAEPDESEEDEQTQSLIKEKV